MTRQVNAQRLSGARASLAEALAALSLLSASAGAQELTGLVFSAEDRTPIAGATVWLFDADVVIVDSTQTDELGRFTLERPAAGSWSLVARHGDYLGSPPEEFEVAGGEPATFLLELEPLPSRSGKVTTAESPRGNVTVALVSGTVVDRSTGEPLDGTEVRLTGSERSVLSRWNGRFVLDEIEPGRVMLRVSRLGYAEREHSLEVEAGLAYDLRVPLDREAIPLEEVTVTVRSRGVARILEPVYERMRRGLGGYFLDREALERRGLVTVAEALQGLPSVRVTGRHFRPRVRIRRGIGCSPVVFVDGWRVGKGERAEEFLAMYATEVEIVEVFPGPSTIPPEYGTADYCAIGIWTRR